MRSTYGAVPGSTLEDWPVNATRTLNLTTKWPSGKSGCRATIRIINSRAPRQRPLPMPPLSPNREYAILKPAAERLGLHPLGVPMLRNSAPFQRPADPACAAAGAWDSLAKSTPRTGHTNTVIPKVLATGNCELRTAMHDARDSRRNSPGPRDGRFLLGSNGRREVQSAICRGGVGRLSRVWPPLRSKCQNLPRRGWGTASIGWAAICRTTPYPGAWGSLIQRFTTILGPGATLIAICDFSHGNKGLIGGGMLANEFILTFPHPVCRFRRSRPKSRAGGLPHKAFVREKLPRKASSSKGRCNRCRCSTLECSSIPR